MKKLFSLLFAVVISMSALTVTSYADKWKKTSDGYVYVYSDGSKAEKGWLTVDGKKYYIQKDGTRKTGWMTASNGTKYYFDKNGVLARNKQVKFSSGSSYYFDQSGKMAVDYTLKKGKKLYYYGSDGKLEATAALKLGMSLKKFNAVVDETYYGLEVEDMASFVKANEVSGIEYYDAYLFFDDILVVYGYGFESSDVSLKKIRKYFTDKLGAEPSYLNTKNGECYWKFSSYYLCICSSDDYYFALYSPICLVEKQKDTSASKESSKTSSSSSNSVSYENKNSSSSASQSKTVYVTKTGKKYHYNGSCNGGTYYASTLEEAKRRGLTPCEKCAK